MSEFDDFKTCLRTQVSLDLDALDVAFFGPLNDLSDWWVRRSEKLQKFFVALLGLSAAATATGPLSVFLTKLLGVSTKELGAENRSFPSRSCCCSRRIGGHKSCDQMLPSGEGLVKLMCEAPIGRKSGNAAVGPLNLADLGHLFRQASICHFVAGHAEDRPRGAHRDGKPRIGVQDRWLHPIETVARQGPVPAGERVLPVAASRGGLRRRPSQKASGRNARFPFWAGRHPIIGRARLVFARDKAVLGALDHTSLTRRTTNERVNHRPLRPACFPTRSSQLRRFHKSRTPNAGTDRAACGEYLPRYEARWLQGHKCAARDAGCGATTAPG